MNLYRKGRVLKLASFEGPMILSKYIVIGAENYVYLTCVFSQLLTPTKSAVFKGRRGAEPQCHGR